MSFFQNESSKELKQGLSGDGASTGSTGFKWSAAVVDCSSYDQPASANLYCICIIFVSYLYCWLMLLWSIAYNTQPWHAFLYNTNCGSCDQPASTNLYSQLMLLFVLSIDTLLYLYRQLMINSVPYALHNTHWVSYDQLTSANLFCVCFFTVSYLDLYRVLILYYTKPIEADMINQLPLGKLPPPAPAATDRAVSQTFWLSFPLM